MTEPNAADEAQIAAAQEGVQPSAAEAAQAQRVIVDQLRSDAEDARSSLLRAQADLENYRKRARKELEDELRYSNMPLLRDLLPVVDNIGRGIAAAEKAEQTPESAKLLEGIQLVARQLDDVLARYGVQQIVAAGQPFDPNLHQAIMQQPTNEVPPQTIVGVAQEGYQLHDRVVRPSQVIVSKAAD